MIVWLWEPVAFCGRRGRAFVWGHPLSSTVMWSCRCMRSCFSNGLTSFEIHQPSNHTATLVHIKGWWCAREFFLGNAETSTIPATAKAVTQWIKQLFKHILVTRCCYVNTAATLRQLLGFCFPSQPPKKLLCVSNTLNRIQTSLSHNWNLVCRQILQ